VTSPLIVQRQRFYDSSRHLNRTLTIPHLAALQQWQLHKSGRTKMTTRSRRTPLFLAISVALTCTAFCDLANAQIEPNLESIDRPLWEAGLSGIGVSSPAYPGAADRTSRGLILPWFIYRGPILRADEDSVGARLLKTRTVQFDVGFAGSLGASSDDVAVRKGMPDLGFQFEFGPRMRVNVARPTPSSVVRLDLPLRGVFELKDGIKNRGFAVEPRLAYENRDIGAGWGLGASTSVVFGDRKFNEYLYGVPSAFATPTRRVYVAKSGVVTPRVQFTLSHKLTNDIRLFAFTRYDFAGRGANTESPLHIKNGGASFGLGGVWTLGRSSQKASD
jgi:outer membrane scaffolding protein for murein synthesis (MipA/OmpV family)